MLTIIADNWMTRRKTAHLVVDTLGQPMYSAGRIGDVLDWLHEQEQTAFNVETADGHTYGLTLTAAHSLLEGFILEGKEFGT